MPDRGSGAGERQPEHLFAAGDVIRFEPPPRGRLVVKRVTLTPRDERWLLDDEVACLLLYEDALARVESGELTGTDVVFPIFCVCCCCL